MNMLALLRQCSTDILKRFAGDCTGENNQPIYLLPTTLKPNK